MRLIYVTKLSLAIMLRLLKTFSYKRMLASGYLLYLLCNYSLKCRMPDLYYKTLNNDGTRNDLLAKSGIGRLRYTPVFFYSSPLAQIAVFQLLQSLLKNNVEFEDEFISL